MKCANKSDCKVNAIAGLLGFRAGCSMAFRAEKTESNGMEYSVPGLNNNHQSTKSDFKEKYFSIFWPDSLY